MDSVEKSDSQGTSLHTGSKEARSRKCLCANRASASKAVTGDGEGFGTEVEVEPDSGAPCVGEVGP